MRVLYWHGWLLEGTGSNVYSARVAAAWRRAGHEVVLLCQQPPAERLDFVDGWGTVDGSGVHLAQEPAGSGGRVIVLRPDIGALLPVFVYDAYEGFEVKRFVDLAPGELEAYLQRNVAALAAAAAWRPPDAVVTGHVMAGPVVARRALGDGSYVAKVHGSDIEYAARAQSRYAELAREGLEGARRVTGASRDVLRRALELAPGIEGRTEVVPPGVEIERWRPMPRSAALEQAAARLAGDPDVRRGRGSSVDGPVAEALAAREAELLDELAGTYDQSVPDPDSSERLSALTKQEGPLVGYLGKLIPQKGVERFVEAVALLGPEVRGVVIGFGGFREWLAALVAALDAGDVDGWRWLGRSSPMQLELEPDEVRRSAGVARRITFTGRLDHRYAPPAVAALDVLVVPSTLEEAFGMVAAEGAAAGALPLVARHSALAEVAEALEAAAGVPGLLSFEPGPGATRRLAEAARRILDLPPERGSEVRRAVRRHVASEWTWERTAGRLLEAAVS
jgi:glycosyltransferase involved in cell wall biosynthesis